MRALSWKQCKIKLNKNFNIYQGKPCMKLPHFIKNVIPRIQSIPSADRITSLPLTSAFNFQIP